MNIQPTNSHKTWCRRCVHCIGMKTYHGFQWTGMRDSWAAIDHSWSERRCWQISVPWAITWSLLVSVQYAWIVHCCIKLLYIFAAVQFAAKLSVIMSPCDCPKQTGVILVHKKLFNTVTPSYVAYVIAPLLHVITCYCIYTADFCRYTSLPSMHIIVDTVRLLIDSRPWCTVLNIGLRQTKYFKYCTSCFEWWCHEISCETTLV